MGGNGKYSNYSFSLSWIGSVKYNSVQREIDGAISNKYTNKITVVADSATSLKSIPKGAEANIKDKRKKY